MQPDDPLAQLTPEKAAQGALSYIRRHPEEIAALGRPS